MTITAKFASKCPRCGQMIQPGTSVEWSRGQAARHISCPITTRTPLCPCNVQHDGPCNDLTEAARPDRIAIRPVAARIGTDADDRSYDAWLAHLAEPKHIPVDEIGVYVLPDGAIVKVQPNREKTRTYAKRWVEISSVRLAENETRVHGEYQYEPGLVDQVAREGRRMNLDEAKAFILRYGQCCRCGRGLKHADSVERGIGPVCIQYFAAGTTGASLMAGAA